MDWRPQDVYKLIRMYRRYECLWNFKSETYKLTDLRRNAWIQLAKEFGKEVDEIKRKIKNMRDSYVVEKKKIDKSKNTYEPRLYYYEEMKFLSSVIVLRKYSDLQEVQECSESQNELDNNTLVEYDPLERSQKWSKNMPSNSPDQSDHSTASPTMPVPKKRKKRSLRKFQNDERYDNAIRNDNASNNDNDSSNDNVISNANTNANANSNTNAISNASARDYDDVYIAFGKTIALQLRQLPLIDATKTMSEIHTLLTRRILSNLCSSNQRTTEEYSNYSGDNSP